MTVSEKVLYALNRIARHMQGDRNRTVIARSNDRVTVTRWTTRASPAGARRRGLTPA